MSLLDPVLGVKANFAPNAAVPSVAVTPGWQIVGAWYQDDAGKARLEVLLSIAQAARVVRARIVASLALTQIDLSLVSTSSQQIGRLVSRPFDLAAATIYQIEVECTGGIGASDFAIAHSARVLALAADA